MKHKCWKCKGRGWLYDHADGLLTFGLGYIFQAMDGKDGQKEGRNITCPICDGKGYQIN